MGDFFKLSGKVMNRSIAQSVGDLSKIQLIAADQFLGGVDFHQSEKFHNPAAMEPCDHIL